MSIVIALSAWKNSGKDHAAKILVDEYGFKRVAFADVLKDMVAEEYGIPRESLDDVNLKEAPLLQYPVAPKDKFSLMMNSDQFREYRGANREIAVSFENTAEGFFGVSAEGTLFTLYQTARSLAILKGSTNRSVNPNYWVERALKKLNEDIVITDMRYCNEAEQIKGIAARTNNECVTIRIDRFDESPSKDASERDMDDYVFDMRISNRGTAEDYNDKIREIAQELLGLK